MGYTFNIVEKAILIASIIMYVIGLFANINWLLLISVSGLVLSVIIMIVKDILKEYNARK